MTILMSQIRLIRLIHNDDDDDESNLICKLNFIPTYVGFVSIDKIFCRLLYILHNQEHK